MSSLPAAMARANHTSKRWTTQGPGRARARAARPAQPRIDHSAPGCQNDAAVPSRFVLCITILALTGATLAEQASAATPSASQIRKAVSGAERSKQLWATINVCNTHRHPNTVGIRGQVPALGFSSSISIAISVDFWNPQTKRFRPDPDTERLIRLGSPSTGVHQQGVTFRFDPHAGRFRGSATFMWRRGGKLLGHTDRVTTGGHRDADFGDPHGFSAATCTIR